MCCSVSVTRLHTHCIYSPSKLKGKKMHISCVDKVTYIFLTLTGPYFLANDCRVIDIGQSLSHRDVTSPKTQQIIHLLHCHNGLSSVSRLKMASFSLCHWIFNGNVRQEAVTVRRRLITLILLQEFCKSFHLSEHNVGQKAEWGMNFKNVLHNQPLQIFYMCKEILWQK